MRIFLILTGLLIGGRGADPAPAPDAAPELRERSGVAPELPGAAAEGGPSAPAAAALADGTALLVWESRGEGAEADILFSRRDPGPEGGWLGEPLRLDTDPPGAVRSLEPRIAVGRGPAVHVAWQSARDGEDDIFVRRSTDGGRSWGPEIRVDGDPPGASLSSMPALAADGRGRVYVAWEDRRNGDRDIYFARSTDGGATFRPEVRVDADEPGSGVSYHPDLLCWDDGSVLVFWRDERDGLADVYLRRSTDAGRTWHPEARLDQRTRGTPRGGEPGATASMHLGVAAGEGGAWAAVWAEGGREVVGARFQPSEGSGWTPFRVANDWRSGVVPDDRLEAAAMGRGVIPAAALAGGHVQWASAAGDRVWYATPYEAGLRVACRDVSVFDVALDSGDREGESRARPTGITGCGLPGGGLFLAWVRDSDSGPRLESVILPDEER